MVVVIFYFFLFIAETQHRRINFTLVLADRQHAVLADPIQRCLVEGSGFLGQLNFLCLYYKSLGVGFSSLLCQLIGKIHIRLTIAARQHCKCQNARQKQRHKTFDFFHNTSSKQNILQNLSEI